MHSDAKPGRRGDVRRARRRPGCRQLGRLVRREHHVANAAGDVQAGEALHAYWLQRDRLAGAADQDIRPDADTNGRAGSDAAIFTYQRRRTHCVSGREHRPYQHAGIVVADIDSELVDAAVIAGKLPRNDQNAFIESPAHRLQGEIARARGAEDYVKNAREHFLRSIEVSRFRGHLHYEWEATIALADLLATEGRTVEAKQLASQLAARLPEGCGNLQEVHARELLRQIQR
jgi:hypothetical protein